MIVCYLSARYELTHAVYLLYRFAVKTPGPVYAMRGYAMPTYRLAPTCHVLLVGLN